MFDPKPSRVTKSIVSCQVHLEPGENANYQWAVACEVDGDSHGGNESYEKIMHDATAALERTRAREPQIFAHNEQFNDWLNRSLADLHMMRTETRYGPYPYAGVPWFSTVFGRDGIITALQTLWFDPSLARGHYEYRTPLSFAVRENQLDVAALLLERGADPALKSDQGMTVMEMAKVEGAPIELLTKIETGASQKSEVRSQK